MTDADAPSDRRGPSDGIRVLHVDDEPGFADTAAALLEREDDRFEVVTATDASEGLDALATRDVDCIVSDYDMPGRNGLEFFEAVRREHEAVPFVLFTGKGSEEVASEAISAGVTDYLQKEGGTEQYTILANRVINAVDTTRAEAERRRQLRAIETAHEGISILDEDGRFVYVNEAYADLYGYEPAEMVGEHWELIYPEEEVEYTREEILPTVDEAGDWHGETIGLRADGSTFVEDHALARTEHGELVCTVRDVTDERRRARDVERYESILAATGDPVYTIDDEGRFTFVNDAFADLTGYAAEAVLGEDVSIVMDEADVERGEQLIRSLLDSDDERATFEMDVLAPDGSRIPCENHVALLPFEEEFRGTVGVLRDITERREREQELERYRRIVDAMGDGVYALDEDSRYVDVNDYIVELTGFDRDVWVGADPTLVHTEAEIREFEAAIRELLGGSDASVKSVRSKLTTADGGRVPVEVNLTLLSGEDGRFRGTVGVVRDISDRVERERELEQYESILKTIPDEVYTLDPEGDLSSVVPPVDEELTTTGYRPEELIGKHVSVLMKEADIEKAEGIIRELLKADDREKASFEMDLLTKGGERVPHENHIALLPGDEDGRFQGTVGVLRDITERKEREHELERQNARLEEFAGIVSHDLRNPLSVAEGRIDLAREDCDSEHLDHVSRAHDRMDALIEDLLTLAREGDTATSVERVDLAAALDAAWQNVETAAARLVAETDRDVWADESRLQQLLENLLRNAVEHGGSEVTVTVGDLDDGFFVADTGPGIPESERDTVFETGYSTTDDGTGFGLGIVAEIAAAHDWQVTVTEGSDDGARFEITGVEVERGGGDIE